jgi:DNA-binding GntR family transcriptional regulator
MAVAPLIPRAVLADQVKDRLLEGIMDGYYPPDSRIVETQVARALDTSQAPVREALRGLEALGLVEITPFRGARVRRPSRREIIEAYAVRSALEALGGSLAVDRVTDADVADLADELAAMRAAARDDDSHAVAEADARFHGRIMDIADNGELERVWGTLQPFSRTYITLAVPGADQGWSAELHAPILAAIERRDADATVAAIRRHFDEITADMASRLPADEAEPTATARTRSRRTS